MSRLELTSERTKIIDTARDEWLEHGLSTAPADFEAAEIAIASLYAAIDKPRPYFVRLSSPLGAEVYINLLTKTRPDIKPDHLGGQLGGQLWDQLRGQLGGQLGDQLGGQLGDQLGGQLRDRLWDRLWGQLRDRLWDRLWGQLRDQLRGQLRDQLGGQNLSYMGTRFSGQWDYVWMWLETGERLGVPYDSSQATMLRSHCTICRSIGCWYPFDDFCIITDRPTVIALNDAGRLHSESGPALAYRDGSSYHSWNGTGVPAHWVEQKDTLDPAEVLRAENVEQRAAGAAIIGWPKMADKLNRKIIDGDPSSDIGALVELTLPGLPEPGRFLQAMCPRNGIICEGVPRESDIDGLPINTAIAAQAWRDGLPAAEYDHPSIRT